MEILKLKKKSDHTLGKIEEETTDFKEMNL